GISFAIPIPSQGKLHFPCAASQLSFCSSRLGTKRTPLRSWAESTTEYESRPFVKSNPDGRFLFLEVISIPCPHFQITITQRSKGQSAVAGAAYQSGEK